MDLGGTIAKRFQMIKHACHFRRTLSVVLVFEATRKPIWIVRAPQRFFAGAVFDLAAAFSVATVVSGKVP